MTPPAAEMAARFISYVSPGLRGSRPSTLRKKESLRAGRGADPELVRAEESTNEELARDRSSTPALPPRRHPDHQGHVADWRPPCNTGLAGRLAFVKRLSRLAPITAIAQ
jgi:hypothetical protein